MDVMFEGGGEVPKHLMTLVELVLDEDDQLVEEKRLPGENTVSTTYRNVPAVW